MNPHSLLVIGELCADIVVELDEPPRFDQHEHVVPNTTITMGSSSAITACGTAALGVPTTFVGVAGDDMLGRFVLDRLRERGVDIEPSHIDSTHPTGSSTILTLPGGDRSILTALGSIGLVSIDHVPGRRIADAAHVHVGSYFLQYALHDGSLAELFGDCRDNGKTTSLDPNFDPSENWSSGIEAVLPHTDVFFCSQHEARRLSGNASDAEAVDWFAARLPPTAVLVLKAGAAGATAYRGADVIATATPVDDGRRLVDTVGAGDSLAAGFLAAHLRQRPTSECLELGVLNGTASTRAAGGIAGQLNQMQVQGLLA